LTTLKTHALLLINPASGDPSPTADEVAAEARKLGVEARILEKGEDPAEIARESGASILGMAGGDGSLAAVAAVALETDAAFVCIPFGTRNHFARDVGLDRGDPIGAVRCFAEGAVERRIDVGRVQGRLFLNNVSLGVYAGLVHRRERRRRRGEALARLRALGAVARHRHRLHATVNGEPVSARVLLIGNNAYEISLFTVGERDRLDTGELQLWAAPGWLPMSWHDRVSPKFTIELDGAHVRAAIDGEPALLEPPLVFESVQGALRVLIPADEGGTMHDNPEATEQEQELAQTGRQEEEESMRYPSDGQPDAPDESPERAEK
jgi:diacylglycerol kinase family enzyme